MIKSFKIDHTKLNIGIYLHDIKKIQNSYITTFDLRFKLPNKGNYLSNSAMHSLEHIIATYYSKYKEKIYFGPMGCQTGFYLVVYGKKTIEWLKESLIGLDKYINSLDIVPAKDKHSCGHYANLSITIAKKEWNKWYKQKNKWDYKYKKS